MRNIRFSKNFNEELATLLLQGLDRFGARVIAQKREAVYKTIENFLVHFPLRPIDEKLGIYTYPVTGTPFVLLYDFDDAELRIYLIIHGSSDRTLIDLKSVEW
jgi:mRNA-degrading endonuclease RelE of RelBE toxin-antitoxin system